MADIPQAQPQEQGQGASKEHVLLIVVASDPASFDELLTVLLDFGVSGATLVESKGMAAVLREEMPIFAGLVALLPGATGSRMLFSVTTPDQASKVLDYIAGESRDDTRPIAVTLPILRVSGMKR